MIGYCSYYLYLIELFLKNALIVWMIYYMRQIVAFGFEMDGLIDEEYLTVNEIVDTYLIDSLEDFGIVQSYCVYLIDQGEYLIVWKIYYTCWIAAFEFEKDDQIVGIFS